MTITDASGSRWPTQADVLATLLPGFAGTTLPGWLQTRLRAGLGGVCLFASNIATPPQLRALTDAVRSANPDAIIAADEEGGDVTRLFAAVGSPSPGNAVLGRIDDPELTRWSAAQIGWQLRRAGITVDFAPSVDVNSRADNPVIGVRSFGGTHDLVARHATAWIAGLQATGVAATAKHFPGHGDTTQDSHVALPVVDCSADELRRRELVPFVAAVEAGAELVMTSHVRLPQLDPENPATMSPALLTGLLREDLGFAGVIVSDALDMAGARGVGGLGEAAVQALGAGCDLLCLGTANTDAELTEIEQAVQTALGQGRLRSTQVTGAAARVRGLARRLSVVGASLPEPVGATADWLSGNPRADDAVLIGSFDLQPSASRWRVTAGATFSVVRLESEPNFAVGATPWGPFAHAAHDPTEPLSRAFAARRQVVITPASSPSRPTLDEPVLVVGRDIHRHRFARAAVDRLRAGHSDVLVVDMGWPSEDRRYADMATFGASRLIGRALLTWLAERPVSPALV